MDKPNVSPGDWVRIGKIEAVVCQVIKESPPDIEVVFLSGGSSKTTNQDATWVNDHWELDTASGGYADNYPRLAQFRAILHRGRQHK